MPHEAPLTELQIAILSVLWDEGETTSAQVREDLAPGRPLALTTVTTLLGRLEKKGVVAHRRDGRRYLYRATISRDEVRREMVDGLTESLFDGDPLHLMNHVLASHQLDEDGRARLRGLIEEA